MSASFFYSPMYSPKLVSRQIFFIVVISVSVSSHYHESFPTLLTFTVSALFFVLPCILLNLYLFSFFVLFCYSCVTLIPLSLILFSLAPFYSSLYHPIIPSRLIYICCYFCGTFIPLSLISFFSAHFSILPCITLSFHLVCLFVVISASLFAVFPVPLARNHPFHPTH